MDPNAQQDAPDPDLSEQGADGATSVGEVRTAGWLDTIGGLARNVGSWLAS